MDIREFFLDKRHDQYRLIDSEHPLKILVGYNSEGNKSIAIECDRNCEKLKSTSAINISIKEIGGTDYIYLIFDLIKDELDDLFYKLINDLFESSKNIDNKQECLRKICERYNHWKGLFFKQTGLLSEDQQLGLIGELLYLKETLFKTMSKQSAINAWMGSENLHKDFSYNNFWNEVKSTHISSDSVKISSIAQLDALTEGELDVFEFEKMSPEYDGYSLNKVVHSILDDLNDSEKDEFTEKLKVRNWYDDSEYDKYVFRLATFKKYKVDENFPRILKKDLKHGIVKASYSLDKAVLENYIKK